LVQRILRKVGFRIRTYRMEKGWTQEDLAHESGLHRAQVGAIERGERNLTLRTMKTLADTLGVRVADLVADI
jgi:transcriptional regulator with XRE-family HTH domain